MEILHSPKMSQIQVSRGQLSFNYFIFLVCINGTEGDYHGETGITDDIDGAFLNKILTHPLLDFDKVEFYAKNN